LSEIQYFDRGQVALSLDESEEYATIQTNMEMLGRKARPSVKRKKRNLLALAIHSW
jgi:hypothetical protein